MISKPVVSSTAAQTLCLQHICIGDNHLNVKNDFAVMAVKRKENPVSSPVVAWSHTLSKNKKPEFTVYAEVEWV